MENKSHVVIATIFLVVLAMGAVLFYFWLHQGKKASRVYDIVTAHTVKGLHSQAPVKFKGLTAGHVVLVKYDPDNPNKVLIRFAVYDKIPVTTATYAQLASKIVGITSLSLYNPDKSAKPLKTNGDHPARIPLHQSLISQLKGSAKKDMKKVDTILDNTQKLLSQSNRQHLEQTITSADKATKQLVTAEKAIMPALKQMPDLARETKENLAASKKLIAQMQQLVHQAHGPIRKASKVEDSIQSLSESAQQLTRKLNNQTLPHMDKLTQSASQAAEQIQQLARELKERPQSAIFGVPQAPPGPGEPGFNNSQ
jgi:phospholipid/cholesterol/gamma-HCH transport system substrate-binding protein